MVKAIAERIKGLREDLGISVERMAVLCGMDVEEYIRHESGEADYAFSFLNRCASILGVDIGEIITGVGEGRLNTFQIERKGQGLPVDRRDKFEYLHLASRFKNHKIMPLHVTVPFDGASDRSIEVNTHEGYEFDYVLEGSLKLVLNEKTVVLNEGDSAIYDSSIPHGMTAVTETGCKFLAIVIGV